MQQISNDLNEIHTPRIISQLQKILRYRLGDEIAIPLLVADKKAPILESLMEKANHIASLKADLVNDLANVVEDLNSQ